MLCSTNQFIFNFLDHHPLTAGQRKKPNPEVKVAPGQVRPQIPDENVEVVPSPALLVEKANEVVPGHDHPEVVTDLGIVVAVEDTVPDQGTINGNQEKRKVAADPEVEAGIKSIVLDQGPGIGSVANYR